MDTRFVFTTLLSVLAGGAAGFYFTSNQAPNLDGAVVAFSRESCPPGWSRFDPAAGRMILGAGKGPTLSERNHGDTGGGEPSQRELPRLPDVAPPSTSDGIINPIEPDYIPPLVSPYEMNTLPPFIVLTLCAK